VAALASTALAAEESAALRAYVVRIELRWGHSPLLTQDVRAAVLADLQALRARTLGEHWQATFHESELVGSSTVALQRWTETDLPREPADKHFVLAIAEEGGGYTVTGFEWDTAVVSRSRTGQVFAADRDSVASAVWRVVQDVYRPLAEIQRTRAGEFRLAPRAAALKPPDLRWEPLRPGEYWEPVNLHLDSEDKVTRVQPVPWTYLKLVKPEGLDASIEVVSGIRSPLPSRRRRIRTLALRVAPGESGSRLTLRNRSVHSRPMAGLEVRVHQNEKDPPETLVTDRLGVVTIPASKTSAPVWLSVYSGQELLARVPFISGLRTGEVLDLPDDSIRLKIEGELTLLQADLVDTVARRATILATARKRAKEGNVQAVDEQLTLLKDLKKPTVFTTELASIRLHGTQAARERKNRAAELRIAKLCEDANALISAYMNPDRTRQLEEEAADLREVAKENQDALKGVGKKMAPTTKPAVPKPAPARPKPALTPKPMPGL
jgi:hypothetical protein